MKSELDQTRIIHQDQENNGNKIYRKKGKTQKGKTGYGHKKSFNLNNRARASDKAQGEFMLSLLVS